MRARDNPFRTDRVLMVRYRLSEHVTMQAHLDRFQDLGHRAAIVGPHGSGKTTLQEDIAASLHSQGRTIRWLRFNCENRHQAPRQIESVLAVTRTEDLLFVDGAEQLPLLRWRRLLRQTAACAGLLITLHTPGRLPTLIDCRTTPDLLSDIVDQLTPLAVHPDRKLLDELYQRHQGNLRLCLRELYDRWAAVPESESIQTLRRTHRGPSSTDAMFHSMSRAASAVPGPWPNDGSQ